MYDGNDMRWLYNYAGNNSVQIAGFSPVVRQHRDLALATQRSHVQNTLCTWQIDAIAVILLTDAPYEYPSH